jgi:hypothetical protein
MAMLKKRLVVGWYMRSRSAVLTATCAPATSFAVIGKSSSSVW